MGRDVRGICRQLCQVHSSPLRRRRLRFSFLGARIVAEEPVAEETRRSKKFTEEKSRSPAGSHNRRPLVEFHLKRLHSLHPLALAH